MEKCTYSAKSRLVLTTCRLACLGLKGKSAFLQSFCEWLQLAIVDEPSVAPWYGQAHGSYAEPVFVGPYIRSTAAFRFGAPTVVKL